MGGEGGGRRRLCQRIRSYLYSENRIENWIKCSAHRVPPGMRSIHPHKWHLCGWIERIPGGEPGRMAVWKPA